jgi:hypothetical protein
MPYILRIDGVEQPLVFDVRTLLNTEAIAWQKVSDRLPADVVRGFAQGEAEALTLVVWICRRRAGEPDLKYSDVVFDMAKSTMTFEAEDDQTEEEGEQGSDPPSPESAAASSPSKRKRSSTSLGSRSS